MVSRIATHSKPDVALVIEADGNMNMPAEFGFAPGDVGRRRHRPALELVPGRCLEPRVPRWSRWSSRRAAITSAQNWATDSGSSATARSQPSLGADEPPVGAKSSSMAQRRRQVVAFGSDRRPHVCAVSYTHLRAHETRHD